jgi:hypothetical protein
MPPFSTGLPMGYSAAWAADTLKATMARAKAFFIMWVILEARLKRRILKT